MPNSSFFLPGEVKSITHYGVKRRRRTKALKPAALRAVKKTFSLPGALYEQASHRAALSGYSTFSNYLQALMRTDIQSNGAGTIA